MGGVKKIVKQIVSKPLQDLGIIKEPAQEAPAAAPAPAPAPVIQAPPPVAAPVQEAPAAAQAAPATPTAGADEEVQAEAQAKANRRGKKGVTINRVSGGGSGLNV
ncbi:hypothetical protein CJ97_gp36 [Ralstonia phage RSB2]|uniref:Uncharacterized protein ORF36 n=1 Tax=Ralstonia phage RSB2 TaxID=913183 RepID=E5RV16_9CAUD|nr:hypothetical protein CJ97_gp36 [Ralstonia phage RSB2]BAJ51824.1 hypothetical protein [Ralstonia phage RSB2]